MVLFVSYSGTLGGAERLLLEFALGLECERAIACPPGDLDDCARAAELRTFALRDRSLRLRGGARRRARAVVELAGHARELSRLLDALAPQVVVAWGMRSLLAVAAVDRRGAPLAFQHNDFLPGPALGALVRSAAARAALVTVPSQAVLDDLDPAGRLRRCARVIAPGVALERFAREGGPGSPSEVLVLGALAPWKRPELALEAVALVRSRRPDVRLTLAGAPLPGDDPGFLDRLRARADRPDLHGAVRFAGQVPDPAAELARCTCLLHCAEREPFGIAVAEALAAGRPVVAPGAGGPAEIVDASCGLLYAPGDARAAAEALTRVFEDPAGAARMGAAGRARAAERFALERQRARYREALAGLGPEPRLARAELTVVTVTHNSAVVLPAFLRSVRRHLPGVEVIVADSGSTDDTRALARDVTVLELPNIGFGAACNRALEQVRTRVVALLNPDVELVDDSLAALAAEAASPARPERLLAPRVLNGDGSLQDSVHPAPVSLAELVRALVPPALVPGRAGAALAPWRARRPRRVGWAVGCALVARTDTLRALGPFDERIFLYGEDMELGLRAARAGVRTWLWPPARVIHHGGHSIEAAHGGEPFALRAQARHDALALALGPRRAALDDRVQSLTFASRRALKRALGRPADRERRQLQALRWERFAQRDPQYYIDPRLGPGTRIEEFREGGRGVVEWAVDWAGAVPDHERALEIGCGLGRNTVHLARHFAHVDGVDVSATMVRRARERGLPDNVALHALSGRDLRPLPDASYALVFSHLVFQHIEPAAIVEGYLDEVARVLKPGGVAVLQFDTRPASALLSLAYRLPDALLPRERRRGIRRHRRDPSAIREAAKRAGLRLETEHEPGTADHWLRWRRT